MTHTKHMAHGARFSRWMVGACFAAAIGILLWSVTEWWLQWAGAPRDSGADADAASQATTPFEAPPDTPLFPDVLSIDDADVHDGVWYVVDGTAARVHRIHPSGEPLASFGRRGQGPGEFPDRPTELTVHGDTIVVMEFAGRRIHLFNPDGTFVANRLLRLDGCLSSGIRQVVSTRAGLLFLVVCFGADMREEARVILERRDGILQTVAGHGSQSPGPAAIVGLVWHTLAAHPRGFVFGSNTDQCLRVHNLEGDVLDSVCHDWMEQTSVPEEFQIAMRRRLARLPRSSWTLPESFFPFFGVFVTRDDRWIYRVLASDEPEGYVLAFHDQSEARLPIPIVRYAFVHDESFLAGWENLEGTRIAIQPLEER